MSVITVKELTRSYGVPVRAGGLGAAIRSLFHREYRQIEAVRGISFAVDPGEIVGFIGPNGAGKTTTLKLLSGILYPTAGELRVLGFIPWRRERAFLRQIALIRGSQPLGGAGELTVLDALQFQQLIYEVSDQDFRKNVGELTELLDLGPILHRQVRALSLGERMRAGLASALLYRPRVLFLDEPTIGLDVTAVGLVRRFIADYSRQTGATVLLTSHYMADVELLCKRIVLIDGGLLRYDGDLAGLATKLAPDKLLKITVAGAEQPAWGQFGTVLALEGDKATLRVQRQEVPAITARLLTEFAVVDLAVEEPLLEQVIDQVYRTGVA